MPKPRNARRARGHAAMTGRDLALLRKMRAEATEFNDPLIKTALLYPFGGSAEELANNRRKASIERLRKSIKILRQQRKPKLP